VMCEVGQMCNIKYFPSEEQLNEKMFWSDQKKLQ